MLLYKFRTLANEGHCVSSGAAAVVCRSSWVEFPNETIFDTKLISVVDVLTCFTFLVINLVTFSEVSMAQPGTPTNSLNCEAQGKGRAKGRPRKVTQRSFIDCRWWMVDILSLMLYIKFGWNHIADCSTVLLNGAVLQWSSRLYAWSTAPPQVS